VLGQLSTCNLASGVMPTVPREYEYLLYYCSLEAFYAEDMPPILPRLSYSTVLFAWLFIGHISGETLPYILHYLIMILLYFHPVLFAIMDPL
jgi:hypothetical protein